MPAPICTPRGGGQYNIKYQVFLAGAYLAQLRCLLEHSHLSSRVCYSYGSEETTKTRATNSDM